MLNASLVIFGLLFPDMPDAPNIVEFRLHLKRAVADGKIADVEARDLLNRASHLGLTKDQILEVVETVYEQLFVRYSADGNLTDEEMRSLSHIAMVLGMSPEMIDRIGNKVIASIENQRTM